MEETIVQERRGGRIGRSLRMAWLVVHYTFDRAIEGLRKDLRIMQRESDLFLGALLLLIGLLDFESGRYCDGNSADYLSCTRPAAFYYFDWLDIVFIVVGVFFILFWVLKNRERKDF